VCSVATLQIFIPFTCDKSEEAMLVADVSPRTHEVSINRQNWLSNDWHTSRQPCKGKYFITNEKANGRSGEDIQIYNAT